MNFPETHASDDRRRELCPKVAEFATFAAVCDLRLVSSTAKKSKQDPLVLLLRERLARHSSRHTSGGLVAYQNPNIFFCHLAPLQFSSSSSFISQFLEKKKKNLSRLYIFRFGFLIKSRCVKMLIS